MAELIFSIERNSQIPMYHQVYQYIRTQIASGKLPHGTRLPSIRELARQLDVSRNTTQLAYEQLLSEGYVRSEHKKGFFVEAKMSDSVFAYERIPDTADPVVPTNRHHVDFRTGTVDQDSFPLAKWRSYSNKIMNDPSLYSYGDKEGDTELRRELENYLFQSRGVQAAADQIIIGAGTKSLLLMLLLMLRSQHAIAVEDPGYDLSRNLFSLMGFEVHPIPVTSSGIHTGELRQSPATLLYTTPTHHYPTGVTMPVNQRLDLLRWAHEVDGYIIEDDYDSEFRYIHQPVPSLQSMDHSGRTIFMGTFSKALLPSIRISYMVLPPSLLALYRENAGLFEQSASPIHQKTLARFMKDGHWYPHLRKLKALYRNRMNVLVRELRQEFHTDIDIKGEHSGIFVMVEVKTDQTEAELIERASNHGVGVYGCSKYFVEAKPRYPHLQLGLGKLSEEEVVEGVARLSRAWERPPE